MFPVSMAAQRDHLVQALVKIVSQVDSVDDLTVFLQALGRDHRKFGAMAEHYGAVGSSLLATLEHFSGPAWTPELAADWTAAYELIGSVMTAAGAPDEEGRAAPGGGTGGGPHGGEGPAGLVAGHGGGPRSPVVRRVRAAHPARAGDRLPAGTVGGDRVRDPPAVVALLLHGQRAAPGRAPGVPRPAERRRVGYHVSDQPGDRPQNGTDRPPGRRAHAGSARGRPQSPAGRGQHRAGAAQGHSRAGDRLGAEPAGAAVLRGADRRRPL